MNAEWSEEEIYLAARCAYELAMQGQHAGAARYLAKSIELAVGADFETEARWLLAESLEQTGKADEAKKELVKLVASGLKDKFTAMAKEKIRNPKSEIRNKSE